MLRIPRPQRKVLAMFVPLPGRKGARPVVLRKMSLPPAVWRSVRIAAICAGALALLAAASLLLAVGGPGGGGKRPPPPGPPKPGLVLFRDGKVLARLAPEE